MIPVNNLKRQNGPLMTALAATAGEVIVGGWYILRPRVAGSFTRRLTTILKILLLGVGLIAWMARSGRRICEMARSMVAARTLLVPRQDPIGRSTVLVISRPAGKAVIPGGERFFLAEKPGHL